VRVIGTYPGATPIAGRRYRNNVLIAGATAASYTLTAADIGQQLVYEELVSATTPACRPGSAPPPSPSAPRP
jgi:hypothetical protein